MQYRSLLLFAIVVLAQVFVAEARRAVSNRHHHNSSTWGVTDIVRDMFSFFGGRKVFENANDIPAAHFQERKEIKGIVVKVTDGDTLRVRHVTGKETSAPNFQGSLTEHTIAIRLAAVDAPEVAKFGESGQQFGEAAKNFVADRLLNKRVTIKLLSRDQYGRVIGLVRFRDNTFLPNFLVSKKDMSEQLLMHGLAAVYRQGGAQYDGPVERWNSLERQAIRSKRGMWMNGEHNAELPSEYKKTTKQKTRTKSREFLKV